jgi:hypothetical protein
VLGDVGDPQSVGIATPEAALDEVDGTPPDNPVFPKLPPVGDSSMIPVVGVHGTQGAPELH